MIIMALDHVRDLMHIDSIAHNPTDLSTTTTLVFLTRWITHLCAPIFVFLAGTSAYISLKNHGDISRSRKFLVKRGFWLLLLEFTIVNFGVWFDLGFHTFLFQVIAAIGLGFILLSFMLNLSPKTIGIIGLIIIFGHNILPIIPFAEGSIIKSILFPLFGPGAFLIATKTVFIVGYPPIPWFGILLLGFASGKLFEISDKKRKMIFLKIGAGALLMFFILRFINIYGDPSFWSLQKNAVFTFLSFINVTKYPPSLMFCLITLGIMFLVLAFVEKTKNRFIDIVSVYGKVPLFYYLIHWYIIHPVMIILMFLQGFHWFEMDFASGTFGRPKDVISGVDLWVIYFIWLSIVVILYKPCVWYSKYKVTHRQWWHRYI